MATKKTSSPIIAGETSAKASKTAKTKTAPASEAPVKAASKSKKAGAETADKQELKAAATSKVTFSLPKEAVENAETVAVLGDFNNWQNAVALTKQKDGSFKIAIDLQKGRSYEYRFLIDGVKWENDWAAEAYVPTPFGAFNSVVTA